MGRVRVGLLAALAAVAVRGRMRRGPGPAGPTGAEPAARPHRSGRRRRAAHRVAVRPALRQRLHRDRRGERAQPPAPANATATAATCDYAANTQLVVQIGSSVDDAMANYQTAVKGASFATVVKEGPVGGIDESLHGVGAESVRAHPAPAEARGDDRGARDPSGR